MAMRSSPRFLLAALLLALPSPAPANVTYSCSIPIGVQETYADGVFGGCRLAFLDVPSIARRVVTPAGCRVMQDANADGIHDTLIVENSQVSGQGELWGRCDAGVFNATIEVELEPLAGRPLHSLAEIVPFEVAAADGTMLRGHVYLPDGPGPFATVLEFSPYWNTEYGPSEEQEQVIDGRRTMTGWLQPFMDAGFAVALVNIRGTGESGGCLIWGDAQEQADANTVIDALAAKPWSNGNLGMFGLSYPGWTQWMAVAGGPSPALKAIIPASAVIDHYGLITRNGARLLSGAIVYPLWIAGAGSGAFAAFSYGDFVPDVTVDHVTCPNYLPGLAASAQVEIDGERTPWFDERDLRQKLDGATVPAFMVGGLTFDDGSITQFEGMWQRLAGDKRLLLGQWGHDLPETRPDFPAMAVAWFDQYLRPGPGGERLRPGVVEYQDADGTWHESNRWPPHHAAQTLHVSDLTLVTDAAAAAESAHQFVSSGISWSRTCGAPDHVRYASEPLAQDLELAGNVVLTLTLSSTLSEGNVAVYVWDVDGEGGCGDSHVQITRAMATLRHAGDPGHGTDFPTDRPKTITFGSVPFASTVPAGHRIVLTVGADASEILPIPQRPIITVHTGPGIDSYAVLPVVGASDAQKEVVETTEATGDAGSGAPSGVLLAMLFVACAARRVRCVRRRSDRADPEA
jgi:predicted acyl esterase